MAPRKLAQKSPTRGNPPRHRAFCAEELSDHAVTQIAARIKEWSNRGVRNEFPTSIRKWAQDVRQRERHRIEYSATHSAPSLDTVVAAATALLNAIDKLPHGAIGAIGISLSREWCRLTNARERGVPSSMR
jgi:hypothetical protein